MSDTPLTPRDLLPFYVLNELEPAEREAVEQALRSDPALHDELVGWQESLGQMLAEAAPPAELSAEDLQRLEDQLRAAVSSESTAEPQGAPAPIASVAEARRARSASPVLGPLALAASLASLAIALWVLVDGPKRNDVDRLQAENAALAEELSVLRDTLGRNTEEIERVSTSLRTLGYPQREPIVLAGLEPAPSATGAAFYRPSSSEALFFAFGLPPIDTASSYQLWYITGDGPVSAGTFDIDANGEARVLISELPPASDIAVWAVTREPAGGSPQPTGPMLIRS